MSLNAYQAWLDGTGPLPVPMRVGPLRQAVQRETHLLAKHTRTLKDRPSWGRYQQWAAQDQRVHALACVLEMTSGFAPGKDVERRQSFLPLERQRRRLHQQLVHSAVPEEAAVWLKQTTRSAAERQALAHQLEVWAHAAEFALPPTRKLHFQQQQREQRHALMGKRWTAELSAEARRALPPHLKRMVRDHGGLPLEALEEALFYVPSAHEREALWALLQDGPARPGHVQRLLREREREAQTMGFDSFAGFALRRHVVAQPRTVERLLRRAGARLSPLLGQLFDHLQTLPDDGHEAPQAPWNATYLAQAADAQAPALDDLPKGVLTVVPTMLRVVEDLMALGGWQLAHAPRCQGQGPRQAWQFVLRHPDGRTAELWVAPFQPQSHTDAFTGAEMNILRARWAGPRRAVTPVVWVSWLRDAQASEVEPDDLVQLAHELGHALHVFSLPGLAPLEWERVPPDMSELPSQLMERLAYCPEYLARWSQPVSASVRTQAYWARRMRPSLLEVDLCQQELRRALIDLAAHRHDPEAFDADALDAQVCTLLGMPEHHVARSRASLEAILWNDYAGAVSCYVLDRCLIESLLPVDARAQHIEEMFLQLCERVLPQGTSAQAFNQAWQQWRGEHVLASLTRGVERFARRHGKRQRAALLRQPKRHR